MKRFLSHVAGAGGFSVAAAILVVGLVAAVTSAQQDTTPRPGSVTVSTDSVPDGGDDEVSPPETGGPSTPEERLDLIESRLDQLDELTSDLSDADSALEGRIQGAEESVGKMRGLVDALKSDMTDVRGDIKSMRSDITSVSERLAALVTSVDSLTAKTSKLNADGTYTGTVDPSQFSRKITPTDISGQWPLNRTTGTLDISLLGTPTWGCYGDSRYNVFVTVDVFGKYGCVRLLK